ncbi:hypothetical protein BDZ97DRAFT_1795273 [Flammula alnicola]|nr:hypothetical protein BDZ97DRAFT_1795273 [Flammula alnicola]
MAVKTARQPYTCPLEKWSLAPHHGACPTCAHVLADEPSSTSTLTGTTNADYGAVNNPDLHRGIVATTATEPGADKAQGRTPPPAYASLGPNPPPNPWAYTLTHELPYAYIDAPGAADVRAQRRFFGALFLGWGCICCWVVGEKGGRVGWYAGYLLPISIYSIYIFGIAHRGSSWRMRSALLREEFWVEVSGSGRPKLIGGFIGFRRCGWGERGGDSSRAGCGRGQLLD